MSEAHPLLTQINRLTKNGTPIMASCHDLFRHIVGRGVIPRPDNFPVSRVRTLNQTTASGAQHRTDIENLQQSTGLQAAHGNAVLGRISIGITAERPVETEAGVSPRQGSILVMSLLPNYDLTVLYGGAPMADNKPTWDQTMQDETRAVWRQWGLELPAAPDGSGAAFNPFATLALSPGDVILRAAVSMLETME